MQLTVSTNTPDPEDRKIAFLVILDQLALVDSPAGNRRGVRHLLPTLQAYHGRGEIRA
jgi:hypothetical protein